MTTPDIEKLRGLPEKWRKEAEEDSKLGYYWRCHLQHAKELEAAGLPELLADYERLLRERDKWTEREEEVIAELMKKQELSRHAVLRQGLRLFQLHVEGKIVLPNLAPEHPPAVSEEALGLASYLLATKPPEWQYDVVQDKAKRVLKAMQPPAVSENQRED